ncbi:MAG: bifunctional methionine sulfoxide reductase B/A protein [Spirochaetales bacterium]|nr:bifunctional methionine sulfoxide reductase B/A protein [Spirochaetales bacterium]
MDEAILLNSRLTKEEFAVLEQKGTERAFTGEYYDHHEEGLYLCRRCKSPLYRSSDKFDSRCGWPSFDDEVEGAVNRNIDKDQRRTEITCASCGGHLGHVFLGEGFTDTNTRHCVNSLSLRFVPSRGETGRALFAGGCFWGVEHFFRTKEGVLNTTVGYTGGHKAYPTYKEVCYTETGHVEAIEVTYDPSIITYRELAMLFFEIHDPAQTNGQGPDLGSQYLSRVFYENETQKETAKELIGILKSKGFKPATELAEASAFWPAEDYHQDYYAKTGKTPYCHVFTRRF